MSNDYGLQVENLISQDRFQKEVHRLVTEFKLTRKQAFEVCNDFYFEVAGIDRYSSYDSYRITARNSNQNA
jgi:hypothetical protein